MYNNPYMQNYNANYGQQSLNDRIDSQIAQLNQMKEQLKNNQQPAINQTFQLAPTNHGMRFANTIDDVAKEGVYYETPFFSKDLSVLWIKNTKGEIKTFELTEIIPKDSKDLMIESLQMQLDELKGRLDNEQHATNDDARFNEPSTTEDDGEVGTTTEKNKPTSISRVSNSKKK